MRESWTRSKTNHRTESLYCEMLTLDNCLPLLHENFYESLGIERLSAFDRMNVANRLARPFAFAPTDMLPVLLLYPLRAGQQELLVAPAYRTG